MRRAVKFIIEETSQIGEIRRHLANWSYEVGASEVLAEQINIVINELATNIIKHARRGEIICTFSEDTLNVLAVDKGPGLDPRAFEDGFSTHGTAGNGLGAIKRQSSFCDFYTAPGKGLVIMASFHVKAPVKSKYMIRGFSLPVNGETVSGDDWTCKSDGHELKFMVADGLGHGLLAHKASSEAVDEFNISKNDSTVSDIERIHGRLRSTRGAAVAVGYLDKEKGILEYAGLGNIAGAIISGQSSKGLISFNGTAGISLRKTQNLAYPLPKDFVLVLHSDGLQTNWDLSPYQGILIRHPLIIAGVLYRDFNRGTDDVTVVVVKEND